MNIVQNCQIRLSYEKLESDPAVDFAVSEVKRSRVGEPRIITYLRVKTSRPSSQPILAEHSTGKVCSVKTVKR